MMALTLKINSLFQAVANNDIAQLETLWDEEESNVLRYTSIDKETKSLNTVGIAIKNGHLEALKWLADHGADLSYVGNLSSNVLYAAENGHIHIIRWLVEEQDLIVTSGQKEDYDVLIVAAQHGHIHIVQYLIDSGANLNVLFKRHQTAIKAAAENMHVDVCKLIERYIPDEWLTYSLAFLSRCIYDAIITGSFEMVKWLFSKGTTLRSYDEGYALALKYGHKEIADWFIEMGFVKEHTELEITVEPSISKACVVTAESVSLYQAVSSEDIKRTEILLKAGANANIPDPEYPLIKAVEAGNLPIIKLLIAYGADVNAIGGYGYSVLMKALTTTIVAQEVAMYLAEQKANIDFI